MSTVNTQHNRQFSWFEPARRKATEYESYTLGQQSYPDQWLDVNWPLHFDDGREPFTSDVTAVRSTSWATFRDPDKTMNRPYVARSYREQHSLEVSIHEALEDEIGSHMNPVWRDKVLGKYYAAWPFVEYAQFMSLAYAVREVMVDTLTYALTFQSADKIRHQQDIVHLIFGLQNKVPGYSDDAARPAWLNSEELMPTREVIENIVASNDWAEIVLVLGLVFEPLVGELFKTEFVAQNAAKNGDAVSPMILANVRRDSKRHQRLVRDLSDHLTKDEQFGSSNKGTIEGWLDKWTPMCKKAAHAMQPIFEIEGIEVVSFQASIDRVVSGQRTLLGELGLDYKG
uniref:Alkene monooxygenase beta-subunit n=1 Tax=Alteromonadaceae bacterium PE-TB08W TaxID=1199097 RepID=A0A3G9ES36_9ALTE|nr:alkene monooxygenase beta-subunit [Alteromonadaceae bacterium PE-TB08W]